MATTMAQALAERVRYQISSGEKVLQAGGDQAGAVFGNPADVLSVRATSRTWPGPTTSGCWTR